jgi:hypothetical protein
MRITKPDSAEVQVTLEAPTEDELRYAAETNSVWRDYLASIGKAKKRTRRKPMIGFGTGQD